MTLMYTGVHSFEQPRWRKVAVIPNGFRAKPQRWDKQKGYSINRLARTAAAMSSVK